jgi:hypothetical protein
MLWQICIWKGLSKMRKIRVRAILKQAKLVQQAQPYDQKEDIKTIERRLRKAYNRSC